MEPGIQPTSQSSVAIVDADRRVRQSLADLLGLAGLCVVGSAGDVAEAASLLERSRPSVVLVDPRLPDIDSGEAFLTFLAAHAPEVRVVLMGWSDPMEHPTFLARAAAYLPKGSSPEEFVSATLAAAAGSA